MRKQLNFCNKNIHFFLLVYSVRYTAVVHCEIGSRYRQNTSLVSTYGIE